MQQLRSQAEGAMPQNIAEPQTQKKVHEEEEEPEAEEQEETEEEEDAEEEEDEEEEEGDKAEELVELAKERSITNEMLRESAKKALRRRRNSNSSFLAKKHDSFYLGSAIRPKRRGKFMEHFFVAGLPPSSLPDQKEPLLPQVLFQYPNFPLPSAELPTMCFPGGIDIKRIRASDSMSDLNEVLYGSLSRLEHSQNAFTFLLTGSDTLYYCFCVWRNELVTSVPSFFNKNANTRGKAAEKNDASGDESGRESPSKEEQPTRSRQRALTESPVYYTSPRAYCIVSQFPFFQLHFDVLYAILALERHAAFVDTENAADKKTEESEAKLDKEDAYTKNEEAGPQTKPDRKGSLLSKVRDKMRHEDGRRKSTRLHIDESMYDMTNSVMDLLSQFYHTRMHRGRTISFKYSTRIFPNLDFTCPRDKEEHLIAEWTVPVVLKFLSTTELLLLLRALLLETKVIVVCQNLNMLTSFVLSFLPLLRPFVWQGTFIPVLPEVWGECVHSPVPFVLGVQQLSSDTRREIEDECLILDLDSQAISLPKKEIPPLLREEELVAKLKPHCDLFYAQHKNTNDSPTATPPTTLSPTTLSPRQEGVEGSTKSSSSSTYKRGHRRHASAFVGGAWDSLTFQQTAAPSPKPSRQRPTLKRSKSSSSLRQIPLEVSLSNSAGRSPATGNIQHGSKGKEKEMAAVQQVLEILSAFHNDVIESLLEGIHSLAASKMKENGEKKEKKEGEQPTTANKRPFLALELDFTQLTTTEREFIIQSMLNENEAKRQADATPTSSRDKHSESSSRTAGRLSHSKRQGESSGHGSSIFVSMSHLTLRKSHKSKAKLEQQEKEQEKEKERQSEMSFFRTFFSTQLFIFFAEEKLIQIVHKREAQKTEHLLRQLDERIARERTQRKTAEDMLRIYGDLFGVAASPPSSFSFPSQTSSSTLTQTTTSTTLAVAPAAQVSQSNKGNMPEGMVALMGVPTAAETEETKHQLTQIQETIDYSTELIQALEFSRAELEKQLQYIQASYLHTVQAQ
ncbi:nephrocystin-1 isoform X2 [Balamuthia mandrillaris]